MISLISLSDYREARAVRLSYQESRLNWSWRLSELLKTALSWLMKWRIYARNFPFMSLSRGRWIQPPLYKPRKQSPRNVSESNWEIDYSDQPFAETDSLKLSKYLPKWVKKKRGLLAVHQHRSAYKVKLFFHKILSYELIKQVIEKYLSLRFRPPKISIIWPMSLLTTYTGLAYALSMLISAMLLTRFCPMVLGRYVFNLHNALNDRSVCGTRCNRYHYKDLYCIRKFWKHIKSEILLLHILSPAFLKDSCSLIRANDENWRTFCRPFCKTWHRGRSFRYQLLHCFRYLPKHRVFPGHFR